MKPIEPAPLFITPLESRLAPPPVFTPSTANDRAKPCGSLRWWQSALIVAVVSAHGLADELTQPLTGRDLDWNDWLSDVAGALAAVVLYRVIVARRLSAKGQQI